MSNTITSTTYIAHDLSSCWFANGTIDFERKMYELKSFLRDVKSNLDNGYWFPDYYTVEKRYQDIESYVECAKIVYAKKEDEDLLRYIYDLPSNSEELAEIDKIVEAAYVLLGDVYFEIKQHLSILISNMKVFNRTSSKRNSPIYYIEQNNSCIIEKYKVGKKSLTKLGSFYASDYSFLYDEDNYVQILSDVVINSENTIIPVVQKLIEAGDCF